MTIVPARAACCIAAIAVLAWPVALVRAGAGTRPVKEVHLTVWSLPRPEDTSIGAKCTRAILRRFKEKYPHIRLTSPTGITIPEMSAMDTRPLMAIAGGVSPDVIYVNFRQSDTYIQEGFLYPLDEWFEKLPEDEQKERLLPQVKKVVHRWGPDKRTGEDPDKHYWALPYSNLIKGLIWRKDLFQEAGLDPNRPPKDWEELYEFARRCTDPEKGRYGYLMPSYVHWAWYFYSFIVSAGGEVMKDTGEDNWVVTFDSPACVDAYHFVLRMVQEPWVHPRTGDLVEGVTFRDETTATTMWSQGRIAMREIYFAEDMLADINPELVGLAPVPAGPGGKLASELNCTMCGIFSGAAKKGRDVLEAAWKYVHFIGSPEAKAIRTRVMVENGYGMFANPRYLQKLGYTDYLRRIPKSWRDAFEQAMTHGEPEPYGRNCQNVYKYMTCPIDEMMLEKLGHRAYDAAESARQRLRKQRPDMPEGELAAELEKVRAEAGEQVRARVGEILGTWVERANVKMMGNVPPAEMRKRRIVALIVAVAMAAGFVGLFAYIVKVFTPAGAKGGWMFRRYWLAYCLLVPALVTIALWQYVPMFRGATMAFQDYHIIRPSRWVGLDNFANILWDGEFWKALRTSLWYAFLAIVMGFFTPIVLAILLHEIPKGKILFRTLYYLPAVISGLVVMLMWKSFFEPSKRGLFNQLITGIPPWGLYALAAAIVAAFAVAAYFNLRQGRTAAGWVLVSIGALALAGSAAFLTSVELPLKHQRWLEDPTWAMFCIILPTVWAGMGPGCLIYLAALKTIPEDLYEAADLDGAGFLGKARHITIPTIKVLILINFIGAVVNAFRVAGYILAMTGGGPAGATQVLALKVFFDAFVYLRFGMATATAWMLGAMLIGFTVFQLRRLSRVEFRTAA